MAPWTFDVKFSGGTQFIFGSLTFTAGEDVDLKVLPSGPTLEHIAPAHGQDPWSPATFVGIYIHTAKIIRGISVVTYILRPLAGASSSSSSTASPEPDSSDDYPEIEVGASGDSIVESRLICMVAPNEDPLRNSSSKYPTIRRSEVSNARTPNAGLVQNLNLDFNAVRLQMILELIQRMAPEGSPLIALAQHGAEAANLAVAERSADNPPREPSIGNKDQARWDRVEAVS
jgi:hypothetical protein